MKIQITTHADWALGEGIRDGGGDWAVAYDWNGYSYLSVDRKRRGLVVFKACNRAWWGLVLTFLHELVHCMIYRVWKDDGKQFYKNRAFDVWWMKWKVELNRKQRNWVFPRPYGYKVGVREWDKEA